MTEEESSLPLFTPTEHRFLDAMGALCRDERGVLVLMGLDEEETRRYMWGHRRSMEAGPGQAPDADYLALSRKHHLARFEMLGSGLPPRGDPPPH